MADQHDFPNVEQLLATAKYTRFSPEWGQKNILAGAINAGPLGSYNTAAELLGLPPLHLDTDPAGKIPYSVEWFSQGLSAGAGSVLPLTLMGTLTGSLMRHIDLKFAANAVWKAKVSPYLNSRGIALTAGAGIYGALQMPDETHSRLGNAIGMGVGMAIFAKGNELLKDASVVQKAFSYPLLGFIGGGLTSEVSQFASNFKLTSTDELMQAAVQGMAFNTIMGLGSDYFNSKLSQRIRPETETSDNVANVLSKQNYSYTQAQKREMYQVYQKAPVSLREQQIRKSVVDALEWFDQHPNAAPPLFGFGGEVDSPFNSSAVQLLDVINSTEPHNGFTARKILDNALYLHEAGAARIAELASNERLYELYQSLARDAANLGIRQSITSGLRWFDSYPSVDEQRFTHSFPSFKKPRFDTSGNVPIALNDSAKDLMKTIDRAYDGHSGTSFNYALGKVLGLHEIGLAKMSELVLRELSKDTPKPNSSYTQAQKDEIYQAYQNAPNTVFEQGLRKSVVEALKWFDEHPDAEAPKFDDFNSPLNSSAEQLLGVIEGNYQHFKLSSGLVLRQALLLHELGPAIVDKMYRNELLYEAYPLLAGKDGTELDIRKSITAGLRWFDDHPSAVEPRFDSSGWKTKALNDSAAQLRKVINGAYDLHDDSSFDYALHQVLKLHNAGPEQLAALIQTVLRHRDNSLDYKRTGLYKDRNAFLLNRRLQARD